MWEVEWFESVLNEVTRTWLKADSARRKIITTSTNEIDRQLKLDPLNVGESRDEDERILLFPPMGVNYRVLGRTVTIWKAWVFSKPSK